MFKLMPCVAAAILTAFSSTLVSAETVSDIKVTADLPVMVDHQAAQHWSALTGDLEAAIAARLATHLGEDGADVNVEITELALPGAEGQATEARLVGLVDIRTENMPREDLVDIPAEGMPRKDLRVTATLENVKAPHAAYLALIDAFADHVAARLR